MQPPYYRDRRTMLSTLASGLLAVLGCQTIPTGTTPTLFEHEARREQIVLHSDFTVPASDELLDRLCMQRVRLTGKLDLPTTDVPIHVYLFANDTSYYDFLRLRFPGFPQRRALFVETADELAVYAHWGDYIAEDLRHEVTHGYLHAAVPNLPLWLDEGLAEYFEVGEASRGLNQLHIAHLKNLTDFHPNLQRLEKLTSAADMTQLDYAESWAWVHFFLTSSAETKQMLSNHIADLLVGNASNLEVELLSRFPDPRAALKSHLQKLR